jgi:lysophospholipase L1-like esterase
MDRAESSGLSKHNILLTVTTVLVMLTACELVLRWLAPIGDPFFSRNEPFISLTLYPDARILPNTTSPARFTTDEKGFRVSHSIDYSHKPSHVIRIFLIGGSTTESWFIDDRHTFGALLEQRLNRDLAKQELEAEVINAARGGVASADHYYVAHEVMGYDPDLVIHLMGINDLTPYLNRGFRFEASKTKALIRNALTSIQLSRRAVLLYRLQRYKGKVVRDYTGAERIKARQENAQKPLRPMPAEALIIPESYSHNLELLLDLHRRHHVRAIFMTQPTLWKEHMSQELENLLTSNPGVLPVRYAPGEMDILMERYNDVMRASVERAGQPFYLLDLSRLLPKDMTTFYDDCHFNNPGHERIAEALRQTLLNSVLPSVIAARSSTSPTN